MTMQVFIKIFLEYANYQNPISGFRFIELGKLVNEKK